jgi:hypothetical protein
MPDADPPPAPVRPPVPVALLLNPPPLPELKLPPRPSPGVPQEAMRRIEDVTESGKAKSAAADHLMVLTSS